MNYTVIWSLVAESGLADAWVDVADRSDVTRTAARIEQEIANAPFQTGQMLRSSVNRFAIVPPLGVIFDIIEDDKKVIVQTCWLVG